MHRKKYVPSTGDNIAWTRKQVPIFMKPASGWGERQQRVNKSSSSNKGYEEKGWWWDWEPGMRAQGKAFRGEDPKEQVMWKPRGKVKSRMDKFCIQWKNHMAISYTEPP